MLRSSPKKNTFCPESFCLVLLIHIVDSPSSLIGWKRRTEWASVTTTCIAARPSSLPDLTVSHQIKVLPIIQDIATLRQVSTKRSNIHTDSTSSQLIQLWVKAVPPAKREEVICDLWLPQKPKTVSAEGNWKFGLKDLAISSGKTGISTKYPLEGKDYFHASNCDTHNAYHQVTKFLCVFF